MSNAKVEAKKQRKKQLKASLSPDKCIDPKFVPKQALKVTPENCPRKVIELMVKGDSATLNNMIHNGVITF